MAYDLQLFVDMLNMSISEISTLHSLQFYANQLDVYDLKLQQQNIFR